MRRARSALVTVLATSLVACASASTSPSGDSSSTNSTASGSACSTHGLTVSHAFHASGQETSGTEMDGGACASGADCASDVAFCLLSTTPGATGKCLPIASKCPPYVDEDMGGEARCDCVSAQPDVTGKVAGCSITNGGAYLTLFTDGC